MGNHPLMNDLFRASKGRKCSCDRLSLIRKKWQKGRDGCLPAHPFVCVKGVFVFYIKLLRMIKIA